MRNGNEYMMTRLSMFLMTVFLLLAAACNSSARNSVKNIKDLDENMIDLRMYHENLGDAILKEDQDVAMWLGTGLDSVLNIVAARFDEHRKLSKPFRDDYEKDLKPSLAELNRALENKSWADARTAYTMVTRKCNNCHKDQDVEKEVQNWLHRQ
jgi:hypothetical protein